jgi:hypothetical protein
MFEANQIIVREDLDYPEGALVVHGYAEDGSLLAFEKGGGVQFVIPQEEIPRFSVVSEMERVPIYRKTRFCLEGLDDQTFEGYSDGSHWNGWALPYFDLKAAQTVLDALGALWTLDEEKNVLHARIDLGGGIEDSEWEAKLLVLPDGGSVKGYSLGAGSLIWEEIQT